MIWQQWFLIGWLALGIMMAISNVRKERQPTTGGVAAWSVLIDMLLIWLVVSMTGGAA